MRTSITPTEAPLRYPLYTAEQSRMIDRYAIEQLGIPGYTLMQRAGKAAYDYLRRCWPLARQLCIVCGSGNNGGDGLVVARLARQTGLARSASLSGFTDMTTTKGECTCAQV